MQKIEELNKERGWSFYELSKQTDIAESTIYTWKRKNKCPSLPVLEKICKAYGISLYQFFNGIGDNTLTDEQKEVLSLWSLLDNDEKELLKSHVKFFIKKNQLNCKQLKDKKHN